MIVSSREEHERFVVCLEKYASTTKINGEEWSLMAKDMGWSVDNVKIYAYWYMQQLHNTNNNNNDDGDLDDKMSPSDESMVHFDTEMADDKNGNKLSEGVECMENGNICSNDNEWTYAESLLFDTLLVTYDSKTLHRWERIASLIPDKDQKQCQERWEKIHLLRFKAYSTNVQKEQNNRPSCK